MRSLAMVVLVSALASPVWAADIRKGDAVVVGPGEVIDDDLYVFATTVRIEGEVRGDVLAFGQKVFVPGRIAGDLVVAASEVDVDGSVAGSVRAAGQSLNLRAKEIGRDVVIAGGEALLGPDVVIRKDLLAAGGKLRIASPVGGTVRAAAGELTLDSPVGGDVDARAEKLVVGSKAAIGGLLKYTSSSAAEISPQAQIAKIERLRAPARIPPALAFLVGWVRLAVGLFLLGLVFRLIAPRWSGAALAALRQEPGRSVAWGAVALIAIPALAAFVFVLGALLGGWWVGLIVLACLGIAVALAFPLVGMLAGEWLARKAGKQHVRLAGTLLVGAALLSLVLVVPILGAVLAFATILFGLGALLLGGWNLRRAPAAA